MSNPVYYLLCAICSAMVLWGMVSLSLGTLREQACRQTGLSLGCNALALLLFILSPQPYAAAILFLFLAIKGFLLVKRG